MAAAPERGHIDRTTGELAEPVVAGRVEANHVGVALEQVDEGQEQAAVEPVPVEILRRHVGGGDEHDPFREQAREQAREDHGVGDVLDLEFIEAEQHRFFGDGRGDRRDRVAGPGFLAGGMEPLLDLAHELVEVHAPLRQRRGDGKELVHHHGLAASDLAMNVEPARRWRAAGGEDPAKGAPLGGETTLGERSIETIEPVGKGGLSGIAAERPGRDQGPVAGRERSGGGGPRLIH